MILLVAVRVLSIYGFSAIFNRRSSFYFSFSLFASSQKEEEKEEYTYK